MSMITNFLMLWIRIFNEDVCSGSFATASMAPYTREECIENFRVATATIFTAEQCDKLVDLIMNRLEDVEDLSILGEYLKA